MKLAKKITLLVAGLCMALGAAVFLGGLCLVGFDFSRLNARTFETVTHTVDGDFDRICIEGLECDVLLRVTTGDEVKVTAPESEGIATSVSVENGTLTVTRKDIRKWYEHIGFFFWGGPRQITVDLPARAYESLELKTVSGDIDVPDRFVFDRAEVSATSGDLVFLAPTENVTAKTVSGDLRLKNVGGAGAASTTSGDLQVSQSRCTELTVKTVSGDLHLSDITSGSLTAETTSGNLDLLETTVTGEIFLKTVSGDVDFRILDAEKIRVKTTSGDVNGTLWVEKHITTHTGSGRVDLPDTNPGSSAGSCDVSTTSGDIRIRWGR